MSRLSDKLAAWVDRTPERSEGSVAHVVDALISLALAAAYVALLLATARAIGYARDEGFYFSAAQSYDRWFELLLQSPSKAFERQSVDAFWSANHEHPGLMKSLFALSHRFFFEKLRWFSEAGTAYRFPAMVMGGLAVGVTYLWGARAVSRLGGLVAALSLAFMPQFFHHAHLACFDVPVVTMWLVTSYAYSRSLDRGVRWAIVTGILYGLFLDTKHNAWLFPGVLVLHLVLWRGRDLWRELRAGKIAIPAAFYAVALLGPAVFFMSWPWIWFDTVKRLTEWFRFHVAHDYYNMEFLGITYWKPPMPRLYAWVMTAATVPAVTLVLFAAGLVSRAPGLLPRALVRRWIAEAPPESERALTRSTDLLWALGILVSYAPWLSSNTPIFGGTKHWLTAYPFLCLFAARGFEVLRERARAQAPAWLGRFRLHEALLAVCLLAGPFIMTLRSIPWGLAAYTPLVGGAAGAASIGLNRTFWGYTTGSVEDFINRDARRGAAVYVHDTALQSWSMMQRDGRLRRDLRGTLDIASSSMAIYHHEPHMARVEQQVWVDYGTVRPSMLGLYDGVPVVWVYRRPQAE